MILNSFVHYGDTNYCSSLLYLEIEATTYVALTTDGVGRLPRERLKLF